MASAVAVDGRRGPQLPRDYARRSLPKPEPERQSPLPEEWSEPAAAIRRIVDTLDELINGR
jgi:penicillin-binding protein 1A